MTISCEVGQPLAGGTMMEPGTDDQFEDPP
jgi:hypothetical protein